MRVVSILQPAQIELKLWVLMANIWGDLRIFCMRACTVLVSLQLSFAVSAAIWSKQWRFSFCHSLAFLVRLSPIHTQTPPPPLTLQWKVSAPEVELSQISCSHKRWESEPDIRVCVHMSVRVFFVCVSVATLGVSWIGEIWPSTLVTCPHKQLLCPKSAIVSLDCLRLFTEPAKRAKIHYIRLCLLFSTHTNASPHSLFFSLHCPFHRFHSLLSVPISPLFAQPLSCPSYIQVNFPLYAEHSEHQFLKHLPPYTH